MHRNDDSVFFLYIEPKKKEKLKKPIDDEITKLVELAFSKSKKGSANYSKINEIPRFRFGDGWRGYHGTECGEISEDRDYIFENGLITNSLCVFYVKWYRNSIHENDWIKLKRLGEFYGVDVKLPKFFPFSPESTKEKTHEEHMKDITDMMVNEFSKNVNAEILKKIIDMANGKTTGEI